MNNITSNALGMMCAQIEVLNIDSEVISTASGFFCRRPEGSFLYTCWHVVTGLDPFNLQLKDIPNPRRLRVHYQVVTHKEGVLGIGNRKFLEIDLYKDIEKCKDPLWEQEARGGINPDLNALNIRVPIAVDIVRIPFPLSELEVLFLAFNEQQFFTSFLGPLSKAIIAGYPYGFSVGGTEQPTAVLLTRFVASSATKPGIRILLDGSGSESMSGGPVLAEIDGKLKVWGVYAGAVFPDAIKLSPTQKNDRHAELGVVYPLGWFDISP